MRSLLYLLLLLFPSSLFSQTNNIEEPKYDTTSFDIKSTNSFYFCSKLYKIPRDCDKEDQSNCCSFSSQVYQNQKVMTSGQLGCYNGTSLFWTQFETAEIAKSSYDGYSPQIKKQMKKFKLTPIKFSICGQEVAAYKINYTTAQRYKGYQIVSYGTINGQHIMLQLHSQKELNTSNDLQSIFQQIVQF